MGLQSEDQIELAVNPIPNELDPYYTERKDDPANTPKEQEKLDFLRNEFQHPTPPTEFDPALPTNKKEALQTICQASF